MSCRWMTSSCQQHLTRTLLWIIQTIFFLFFFYSSYFSACYQAKENTPFDAMLLRAHWKQKNIANDMLYTQVIIVFILLRFLYGIIEIIIQRRFGRKECWMHGAADWKVIKRKLTITAIEWLLYSSWICTPIRSILLFSLSSHSPSLFRLIANV